MKKQNVKNLIKRGILLLGIACLITNCETDEADNSIVLDSHNHHSIKQISPLELVQNNLFNNLNQSLNKKAQARQKKSNSNPTINYEFLDEPVLVTSQDSKLSYTASIKESGVTESGYNTKLLIQEINGNVDYFVLEIPKQGGDILVNHLNALTTGLPSSNSGFKCVTTTTEITTPCGCGHDDPKQCGGCEIREPKNPTSTTVHKTTCYYETPPEVSFDPTGSTTSGSTNSVNGLPGISSNQNQPPPIYIYEGQAECDSNGNCTPPLYWAQAEAASGSPSGRDLLQILNVATIDSQGLTNTQRLWVENPANFREIDLILNYLSLNNQSTEAKEFAKELIELAVLETNQNNARSLIKLTLLVENIGNELFTEAFALSLYQYTDIDIADLPPDYGLNFLTLKVFLNYHKNRNLNPEWSTAKCLWYATKEIVHISLDAFGLIPVFGEVADLTNGLIYAIEGDNINATLSVASAIPFVGYGSVATKYGLKVVNAATTVTTKVKLVWKVSANGIEFGASNQLRGVLGLTDSAFQAHHFIPWAKRTHPAVQKAAKSGSAFHMNEALNGIPMHTDFHFGKHANYSNLIQQRLDAININQSANSVYNEIVDIINDVKNAVNNNSTTHINQLVF